jgi:glycosyltransferase involved in cell wall biosynthesis
MRIGIKYTYNENWIGGTYYVENLIKALDQSKLSSDIELVVFAEKESFERIQSLVRNLRVRKGDLFPIYSFGERIINKISRLILRKNIISKSTEIDLIFPLNGRDKYFDKVARKIYWIPDFQDKFLTSFFSTEEKEYRAKSYEFISENATEIVFSSESALQDFRRFFQKSSARTYVLRFAVSHDFLNVPEKDYLLNKYGIESKYFMSPNQFWQHKNHGIILKAAANLKRKGVITQIVFTGKEYDYRNPLYTDQIKQMANDLDISDNVKFLGFIDRNDQIGLMKYAQAIIQPSLFEGWSTVVEDAKALNQCILATDISVHKEQLGDEGNYFSPESEEQLALLMESVLLNNNLKYYSHSYKHSIDRFSESFIDLIGPRI